MRVQLACELCGTTAIAAGVSKPQLKSISLKLMNPNARLCFNFWKKIDFFRRILRSDRVIHGFFIIVIVIASEEYRIYFEIDPNAFFRSSGRGLPSSTIDSASQTP